MPSRWSEYNKTLVIAPEPNTTDTIRVYGKKRPNLLNGTTLTGTGISFTRNASAADTIADSGSGLGAFSVGDVIQVSGGDNDGLVALLTAVASGSVTLHTRVKVTTEAAGTSITLSEVNFVNEESQNVLVALAALRIAQNHNFSKERIDQLRARYYEELSDVREAQDIEPIMIKSKYVAF